MKEVKGRFFVFMIVVTSGFASAINVAADDSSLPAGWEYVPNTQTAVSACINGENLFDSLQALNEVAYVPYQRWGTGYAIMWPEAPAGITPGPCPVDPEPSETASPTNTATPTQTPSSTSTVTPTQTSTPVPTGTATQTVVPTGTTVPDGGGNGSSGSNGDGGNTGGSSNTSNTVVQLPSTGSGSSESSVAAVSIAAAALVAAGVSTLGLRKRSSRA